MTLYWSIHDVIKLSHKNAMKNDSFRSLKLQINEHT